MNNMLQLLFVALLASGVVAEDAKKAVRIQPQPTETASATKDAESAEHPIFTPALPRRLYDDDHNDHLYLKAKLDGHRPEGPVIARSLHSSIGHGPNIAAQDEIIKFTYSPAYYEPVWVLDYRFLKSGGRRYTRGPGGQILILPRSYKHYKGDGTHDYDSMLEHLRLKLIAEQNQRLREHSFANHGEEGYHNEYEPRREHEPVQQNEYEPVHLNEYEPVHENEYEPVHKNEYKPVQRHGHEVHRERDYIERKGPIPKGPSRWQG